MWIKVAALSVAAFQEGENILAHLKSIEANRARDFDGNYMFLDIFNQERFLTFSEEVVSEFSNPHKGDATMHQASETVCLFDLSRAIYLCCQQHPSSNLRPLLGRAHFINVLTANDLM